MEKNPEYDLSLEELETGISLTKCQQCGCMAETLQQIGKSLSLLPEIQAIKFRVGIPGWMEKMKATRYSCLGCEHCYAGVAQNAFTTAFPQVEDQFALSCEILFNSDGWPPVAGEYFVTDANAQVAVTTLASTDLARALRLQDVKDRLSPQGAEAVGTSPEGLARYPRAESEKYAKLIRASGAKAD